MSRSPLRVLVLGTLASALGILPPSFGADRDIPGPFAPLEYLVGAWKGQGVNLVDPAQRVRGWTETHAWAWTFDDGKPTGMSFTMEGSKAFKSGTLTFDAARKKYVMKAEPVAASKDDPTIVFEGVIDGSRKLLTLDRVDAPAGKPAERLTLRANANFIRYTLGYERRAVKAGSFSKASEVGVTKEGEAFASGSTNVERPKCVVTGGAATQSLTYQGRTFPICCSGCRDEFLESPDKYLKKIAEAGDAPKEKGTKKPSQPTRRSRGDDDAFSGDVEEPKEKP